MHTWKKISLWALAILSILVIFRPMRDHLDRRSYEKKQLQQAAREEQGFLGEIKPTRTLTSGKKEEKDDARNISAKDDLHTEIMEYRLRNSARIKSAQTALKNAGFDPGPIDGKMGKKTRKAVVAFQKEKGLTADGIVGAKTWEELSKFLTQQIRKR